MTPKGVILGVGNVLQRDDGVGVKVLKTLEAAYRFPENVELVDGGTVGMGLASLLVDLDWLIVVDAVDMEGTPGEIKLLSGEEFRLASATLKLSPHQVGFLDLIMALELESRAPKEIVLLGVIPEIIDDIPGLSPKVEAAVGDVVERILTLIQKHQITPRVITPPQAPDYWWETRHVDSPPHQ